MYSHYIYQSGAALLVEIPDKMEAAAANTTNQRSSTSGSNSTVSTESQNATSGTAKTSTAGSETGQTSTTASSTNKNVGSTPTGAAPGIHMFCT